MESFQKFSLYFPGELCYVFITSKEDLRTAICLASKCLILFVIENKCMFVRSCHLLTAKHICWPVLVFVSVCPVFRKSALGIQRKSLGIQFLVQCESHLGWVCTQSHRNYYVFALSPAYLLKGLHSLSDQQYKSLLLLCQSYTVYPSVF